MSKSIGCRYGVDQTYGDCVGGFMSMLEASSPPTLEDYKETQMLFRDFCILPAKIPEFHTRNALVLWRTRTIKAALS